MTTGLTLEQIKAASLCAKGLPDRECYESVGASKATFYRWKKLEIFDEVVSLFQNLESERLAILSEIRVEPATCDDARSDEAKFREMAMPLLTGIFEITEQLVETLKASEEVSSPRFIPSFTNVLIELIRCIRESNDRITGLESILDELTEIKKNL